MKTALNITGISTGSVASKQRGAALLISLIMLLAMTMIGVTGMQSTTMQEKMAGNLRDINLAFQAAEAALRQGELLLTASALPDFDGSGHLYQAAEAYETPVWETSGIWAGTKSKEYTGSYADVSQKPRFIVEELPAVVSLESNLAADEPLPEIGMYRVTATGWGGNDKSVAIIQATYKR